MTWWGSQSSSVGTYTNPLSMVLVTVCRVLVNTVPHLGCPSASPLLATILSFSSVVGPTVTGSITGQVTDPSGAVVPGANVTAENVATSVKTSAQTNAAGVYTIRFLPIGTYKVSIDANGFTTQNIGPFNLEIDQTVKVDAKLKIGASSTVEVRETFHPILDTTDATLGNTLSTNEIQNIPLNGRNFSSLTLYQPGAIDTDPTGMTGNNAIERNTYNNGVVAVNGNRQQENNYTIEGADNNEQFRLSSVSLPDQTSL